MNVIEPFVAVALAIAIPDALLAKDRHYRPHVSGPPAGAAVGTLLNYGQGNASGDVTIRQADGKEISFYTAAGPFRIDGRNVRCAFAPTPTYVPPPDLCSKWPSHVRVSISRVRVYYWKGTRYGQPTLITRGFTVLQTMKRAPPGGALSSKSPIRR